MLSFLSELAATAGTAKSLYVSSGSLLPEIEGLLERMLGSQAIVPEIAKHIAESKTGAVVFYDPKRTLLIAPPFPIKTEHFAQGYFIEPLRSLLKPDYKIALILIRLGTYAVGLCDGENLVTSKVGTGLIHGRHKKGGSSQQRFRRHREKQIEYFLNRVCGRVRENLAPYANVLDYVVYGGARTTILLLRKHCPFLEQLDGDILSPLLDIPDPNKAVLEKVVERVWSSRIVTWKEN
jgi:peptide subunit release factor 1 (eRF1)